MPDGRITTEGDALRIVSVTKDFPTPDSPTARTQALAGVSLSVAAGELVSVVGPSGCGKSTLLRLLAGLDFPNSGELWIGNEAIAGPNAECGLVFQDPNLFPWLNVRRNVQAGLFSRDLLHSKGQEADEFIRPLRL